MTDHEARKERRRQRGWLFFELFIAPEGCFGPLPITIIFLIVVSVIMLISNWLWLGVAVAIGLAFLAVYAIYKFIRSFTRGQ